MPQECNNTLVTLILIFFHLCLQSFIYNNFAFSELVKIFIWVPTLRIGKFFSDKKFTMPVGTWTYKEYNCLWWSYCMELCTKNENGSSVFLWAVLGHVFLRTKFWQVIKASIWIYLEKHKKGYAWLWNIKCSWRNSKKISLTEMNEVLIMGYSISKNFI